MATRGDLQDWILEALHAHQGKTASIIAISKYIWDNHEDELRVSGNLFYKWQYDLRWAGKILSDNGKIKKDDPLRGYWKALI